MRKIFLVALAVVTIFSWPLEVNATSSIGPIKVPKGKMKNLRMRRTRGSFAVGVSAGISRSCEREIRRQSELRRQSQSQQLRHQQFLHHVPKHIDIRPIINLQGPRSPRTSQPKTSQSTRTRLCFSDSISPLAKVELDSLCRIISIDSVYLP